MDTWISFSTLSTLQSSQIRLCFGTDLYLPVSIAIGKIPSLSCDNNERSIQFKLVVMYNSGLGYVLKSL